MQTAFLTKRVDNAPLIFFRIAFGLLLAWHSLKYVFGTEIKTQYLTPKYLFPFIGFEWLKPLPGNGMYWYFSIMALTAVFVCIGFMYRFSLLVFTILFTGAYLMQKTIYNNHYYLVILLCILMFFMPANRFTAIDVARKPSIKRYSMPQWCRLVFIFQMITVYMFAAIAKLYPTWMDGTFTGILMKAHRNPTYAFIIQNHYFHLFLAWGGILFDLLIAPLLLYKRTRTTATLVMVFFHLFNSFSLSIGIFPFLALSLIVFFFPPDVIRERLFWLKKEIPENELNLPESPSRKWIMYLLAVYAAIQLLLPVRHYFYPGDVTYSCEGDRLSWRMKLHHKMPYFTLYVKEKGSTRMVTVALKKYFSPAQLVRFPGRPDMVWQAAQYVKEDYAARGKDVALYASTKLSLNHLPPRQILDTTVDLTTVKWSAWKHSPWVLKIDE